MISDDEWQKMKVVELQGQIIALEKRVRLLEAYTEQRR